jgi:hypothetical protein
LKTKIPFVINAGLNWWKLLLRIQITL